MSTFEQGRPSIEYLARSLEFETLLADLSASFVSLPAGDEAPRAEPAGLRRQARRHRTRGLQLPKGKQTTLGLYVTAAQAYEKWKAAPDKVKIIDVRTPEEYASVDHPEMAVNIPLAFVTYQGKDGKTEYGPKMNPSFVAEVSKMAGPTDTLLVMCRSGDRSAMAVNKLARST